MPVSDYLEGLTWMAVTAGPVLVAAWLIQRRFLAHLRGSVAWLAYGLDVTAGLVIVHLLPGMLALLYRGAVALTSLLLLAIVAWICSRGAAPARPAQEPAPG